jgi:ribosome-associated protein
METKKLQRLVIDALEDVKAQDIEVYNTTALSDLFDRVVLVSGTSNRHTRSLASNVAEKVKLAGGTVISIEGAESGEWVLVDLGDIVVHIMQPAIRQYYALEELWGGKPVHVKLHTTATSAVVRPRARRSAAAAKGARSAPGK